MDVNNVAIMAGIFSIIVIISFRIRKLRKNFIDKIELMVTLGYFIFAYVSAVAFVQMSYLAILTFNNELTQDLLSQNKVWVFFAWFIIAIGSLIAYISLLVEDKRRGKD